MALSMYYCTIKCSSSFEFVLTEATEDFIHSEDLGPVFGFPGMVVIIFKGLRTF